MTGPLFVFVYASAVVSVVACVARAIRYATLPMHLRWELYPIPHEEPSRAAHGGSSFEVPERWNHPSKRHRLAEWRYMAIEIVFLRGLWDFNRALWFRSFPFHVGLYLVAMSVFLGVTRVLGSLVAPAVMSGTAGALLALTSRAAGILGIVLAPLGAAALLIRRLTDGRLRIYTTAGDVANLAFFIVTFTVIGTGYLAAGPSFPGIVGLTRALVTFDTSVALSPLLAVGLALGALLVAYIPLTHMSHFIAKYFTYHSVRWDDRANLGGRALERRIAENLAYRPTWSARHMQADGTRTWGEVAAVNPAEGGRR